MKCKMNVIRRDGKYVASVCGFWVPTSESVRIFARLAF